MKITLTKCLCLTTILTLAAAVYIPSVFVETSKLITEPGGSVQSRQQAAMEKEQWNDMRQLRQKVNKRAEKEWDKTDTVFDSHDKCKRSANINAHWKLNTLRRLDRRIGRTVAL